MNIEIINKLKDLGFKEYDAKVFVVLLKGRLMSVPEIAKESKVIRNSIYEILKNFVEKGYCNEIHTDKIQKYEIIDPDIILDKIAKQKIKKHEQEIESLKETFSELKPLYNTKKPDDSIVNIELIRGYNQHREEKFINLMKQAKKEILYMVRLEFYSSLEIDETAKKFFKNGGVIRSIYEISKEFKINREGKWRKGTDKDLISAIRNFEQMGEKVRISTEQIPNMTIFDRKIVFLNIADKSGARHKEADLLIRNIDFAKSMIKVFEAFWKDSKTINEIKKQKL